MRCRRDTAKSHTADTHSRGSLALQKLAVSCCNTTNRLTTAIPTTTNTLNISGGSEKPRALPHQKVHYFPRWFTNLRPEWSTINSSDQRGSTIRWLPRPITRLRCGQLALASRLLMTYLALGCVDALRCVDKHISANQLNGQCQGGP